MIIEVKPFNQYLVKVDGSGRITLRNRKKLRKFTPFQKKVFIPISLPTLSPSLPSEIPVTPPQNSTPSPPLTTKMTASPTQEGPLEIPKDTTEHPENESVDPPEVETPGASGETADTTPPPQTPETPAPRKPEKIPMALRRLLPYNKQGLKE